MTNLTPIRFHSWRELAIIMLVLMEASWVTPWFRSLTPATYFVDGTFAFTILTAIILSGHIFSRLSAYLRLKQSIRQGFLVAILVAGIFLSLKLFLYQHETIPFSQLLSQPFRSFGDIKTIIPVEFIIILAVIVGFWRGVMLAQEHIGPGAVKSHFWVGLVMYVMFIFMNTLVTGETPEQFFYLFVFAALVGMSSARMSVVGMNRGGIQNPFRWSWLAGIILAACLVVLAAIAVGNSFGNHFSWMVGLIVALIGFFVLLLWILVNPVITLLLHLLGNLHGDPLSIKALEENLQRLNDLIRHFGLRISGFIDHSPVMSAISRWGPGLKAIALTLVVLAFIGGLFVWITFQIWRDRQRTWSEEQRRNLDVKTLLNLLLDAIRERVVAASQEIGQLFNFQQRGRIRAIQRIRQIYVELLELCEALHRSRRDFQTPLEFMPDLEQLFPGHKVEIQTITSAYLDIRYGLLPEPVEMVKDVEASWKTLAAAGNQQLSKMKPVKK